MAAGFVADVCIHETGHYVFAYAFNSSSIASFNCHPTETVLILIGRGASFPPYQVVYKGPIVNSLQPYQIPIVGFAGLGFELFSFCGVGLLSSKLASKWQAKARFREMIYTTFLLGLVLGFLGIIYGWTDDGIFVFGLFIQAIWLKLVLLGAIYFAVTLCFFYLARRFVRIYIKILEGYMKDLAKKLQR